MSDPERLPAAAAARRPSLSVIFATHVLIDPAVRSLGALRRWCDEIVVGVDDRLPAAELGRLGHVADVLVTYPFTGPNEFRGWLRDQTQADWILFLDGDEMVSQSLARRLRELVADRLVAGYELPRRWLFGASDQYLASRPWSPDYQLRLVRNDDRLFFRAVKHSGPETTGPTRRIAEPLLHLDLLNSGRAAREAKVARYDLQHFGHLTAGVPTNAAFYLPEDDPGRVMRRLHPAEAPVWEGAPASKPPASVSTRATVSDIRRSVEWVPLGDDGRGQVDVVEAPSVVRAGVRFVVTVRCTNSGGRIWPCDPERPPYVRISYHWTRNGITHTADGLRSGFRSPVLPGAPTELECDVVAPAEPGRHELVLDLVEEGVRWFGVDTTLPIEVIESPGEALARYARAGCVPLGRALQMRRELALPEAVWHALAVQDPEIDDPKAREWAAAVPVELGTIDRSALLVALNSFNSHDPRLVLEFGCGALAIVLAQAAQAAGRRGVSVVSIQRSNDECERLARVLASSGVAELVSLVCAPVVDMSLGEANVRCHDPAVVAASLAGATPQLVVLGGARDARGLARYHSLLMAQRSLREPARFLLGEGWSDMALSIGEAWSRSAGVQVSGIMLVGKGVLVGTVAPSGVP